MHICSVCEEKFEENLENNYFDEEQDKCILHCEKSKSNEWIYSFFNDDNDNYESKKEKWDDKKIHQFWEYLVKYIKKISDDFITLKNIVFPIHWNEKLGHISVISALYKKNVLFDNCIFLDYLYIGHYVDDNEIIKVKFIGFKGCKFKSEVLINNLTLESGLSVLYSTFDEDFNVSSVEVHRLFEVVKSSLNKLSIMHCEFNDNLEIKCNDEKLNLYIDSSKNNKILIIDNINNVSIINSTIEKEFIIDRNNMLINSLDLEETTFESKVKIQFCTIKEKANFYNTKFKDLADFYRTKFNEVIFERTDFEKISVFSEVEFTKNVDFKYTKFLGKSIFRDTIIKGKLNLRDTIFDDDANFLDITSEKREKDKNDKEFIGEAKIIRVANRETARVIKSFYDKSNNIIEANKFYSLEMQERKKELNVKSNFIQWIIFFLHGVSSNYSQSWAEALFWIGLLSSLYTFEMHNIPIMTLFLTYIIIYILLMYLFKQYSVFIKYFEKTMLILFTISFFYILDMNFEVYSELMSVNTLNEIIKNINIFAKINSNDMTIGFFMYKIALSYLIYQFIISVRQNTRRK